MTGMLDALENRGYHFQVDGDHLKVEAADHLLHHQAVEYLQLHKPELVVECRLRTFVRLVRAFGISHGLLLDDDVILAELYDVDRTALMNTDLEGRQAWAQMLAYKLTRPETTGNGQW